MMNSKVQKSRFLKLQIEVIINNAIGSLLQIQVTKLDLCKDVSRKKELQKMELEY